MSLFDQIRNLRPLQNENRPHPLLWYLAGGRMTAELPANGVPTVATLRERRAVEKENREVVGFWGTVHGLRKVKKTRKELAGVCNSIQGTSEDVDDDHDRIKVGRDEKKQPPSEAEGEASPENEPHEKAEDSSVTVAPDTMEEPETLVGGK
ncbi:hypothetical protein LTR62_000072 [Meristemomyces frigidus]|uniref:Uncharacterized protein n=1 Tax=Meristemomyces frigidus TaxID=1508187 RepID=A0AAN7TQZ0_9PEZI|nr:hypothetical protein LTR62_000072 [Meristemomyces frigidus]